MTTIKIFKNKGEIVAFEISGHSGYAKSGHDIVCSAISSISQTTCLGIVKVAKINATIKRDDKKGFLSLRLPKNLDQTQKNNANLLLNTMQQSLSEIAFDYNNYIQMEVQDEIY